VDRSELAAFLRSRRERLRPEDVGLPSGPRRRTPGLRREEIAVLAHISIEYYTRLEQGRAPRPSGTVLLGIAGALRLTAPEVEHLHLLAGTALAPSGPGIVVSAAFEVLAWNDLAAALMEDFSVLAPRDRNLARKAFLTGEEPPAALYGTSDGVEFRQGVVSGLRSARAQHPTDPLIGDLVQELRDGSAEFSRRWERHDVQTPPPLTKTFRHTPVGAITVDCDSLAITDRDQHLVLYTAPAGSRDAEALALLDVVGAQDLAVRGDA
jgi:transcriptional regulator with XRE-family HTH domain